MLIKGHKITVGADPEVFVGQNNQFVSVHDRLPGTKLEPFKVEKGAVQVDGMAAEFNIDPAENFEEFKANLDTVQNTLKGMIGDLDFLEQVSVTFDKEFAESIPPLNLMLGCEADYNGWEVMENESPNGESLMRTAGGHVHIGGFHTDNPFSVKHFKFCARMARILDETLGVFSVLWDTDDKRRSMYGQAGAFRPKPYGLEYRTLSNKWIFSDKLVRFVYDAVAEAVEKSFDADYEPDEKVRQIINESDRESGFFAGNPKAKLLMV